MRCLTVFTGFELWRKRQATFTHLHRCCCVGSVKCLCEHKMLKMFFVIRPPLEMGTNEAITSSHYVVYLMPTCTILFIAILLIRMTFCARPHEHHMWFMCPSTTLMDGNKWKVATSFWLNCFYDGNLKAWFIIPASLAHRHILLAVIFYLYNGRMMFASF